MAVESNLKSGDDDNDDDDEFFDCQNWTWCQPEAKFDGNGSRAKEVEDYLHADVESYTFRGFNDLTHAKNWSLKHFSGVPGSGYHAIVTNVGANLGGGYVKVTKVMTEEDEDELGE